MGVKKKYDISSTFSTFSYSRNLTKNLIAPIPPQANKQMFYLHISWFLSWSRCDRQRRLTSPAKLLYLKLPAIEIQFHKIIVPILEGSAAALSITSITEFRAVSVSVSVSCNGSPTGSVHARITIFTVPSRTRTRDSSCKGPSIWKEPLKIPASSAAGTVACEYTISMCSAW